jgi:UDP-N-acetylmuramoyl-tripeptide--D-alanyl-D-alanine ligase
MKAAIENFAQMSGTNKILLLGSMMELGDESKKEHEEIIKLIEKYTWGKVVLVGDNFKNSNYSFIHLDNSSLAKTWLRDQCFENSQILIKGSRSMQMEKVLEE